LNRDREKFRLAPWQKAIAGKLARRKMSHFIFKASYDKANRTSVRSVFAALACAKAAKFYRPSAATLKMLSQRMFHFAG